MKKVLTFLIVTVLLGIALPAEAEDAPIDASSYILMEAGSGQILREENAHAPLPPASVTKVMTLLLTMEAVDRGELTYDTTVTASRHAKEMGGSTVFLDTGEEMAAEDIIKGIAVASGNDAAVAMAEHLAGSEEAFVERMNARAAELGMKDTHFLNCTGLDADGHVSSAYDIAVMSRELLTHPDILRFTTIWMDSLREGAFTLSNTNKLIRFYEGANGLKTGSTSKAGCCISATAMRGGMQLIAVVMNAPNSNARFAAARALLDEGFARYRVFESEPGTWDIPVKKGTTETAAAKEDGSIHLLLSKEEPEVEVTPVYEAPLRAPVPKGTRVGEVRYHIGERELGTVPIVLEDEVEKISVWRAFIGIVKHYFVRETA